MTATQRYALSAESTFLASLDTDLYPMWQQRKHGYITGQSGLSLYWSAFTRPEHTKAVVLVNGRVETLEKYLEVIFDLVNQGYDVYSYDHRGQGYSDRLVMQPQDIGHVVDFADYVADLHIFIHQVVDKQRYSSRYLLAHSMGGAVATLYAQQHPDAFDAIAMTAPMYGINVKPLLKKTGARLCRVLSWFNHPAGYAPGQGPYQAKAFVDNPLTQSETRFLWFRRLFDDNRHLQIGGPSSRWIWQAMEASERCLTAAETVTTPLLLLQAGKDTIVCNDAIFTFYRRRQRSGQPIQFKIIANARHELLFEQDKYRVPSVTEILDFFALYQGDKTADSKIGKAPA